MTPDRASARKRLPRPGQRGFTLVEVMVAAALGLFVIAAASSLYVTNVTTYRSAESNVSISTAGRYAVETLRRELMHAGYQGISVLRTVSVKGSPEISGDCLAGFSTNLEMRIWASDDSNPFSGTCVPSAQYAGADVLAVRRTSLAPVASLSGSMLNARVAFEGTTVFAGTSPPSGVAAPYTDHTVESSVYFVSAWTDSTDESPRIPALYRVRLGSGPAMGAPELVASGVEAMEVELGVRDATGLLFRQPSDVAAGSVTAATKGSTAWSDVVSVRIHLLVRSDRTEPGYNPGEREYKVGNKTIVVNDRVRREVITTVVQLRNAA